MLFLSGVIRFFSACHRRSHRRPPSPTMLTTSSPPPSSFSLPCSPPSECRRPRMSHGRRWQHRRRPPFAGSHHITLPFLLPTIYSPLIAALLCFVEHRRSRLAATDQPSASLIHCCQRCPTRIPFSWTAQRSHLSSPHREFFPVLGSTATDDPFSPPASHPPAEIPLPPSFSTRVEPSRTFSELSPRCEFHTATVDGVLRLAAGTFVAGFCVDHRGFTPPSSPCHDSRRPAPPLSPAVWPPATAAYRRLRVLSPDSNRPSSPVVAYLGGFDSNHFLACRVPSRI